MNRIPLLPAIVLAVCVFVLLSSMIYTVQQTQQALVRQFGEVRGVVTTPGLHFKMPFVQNVTFIDKRILELDSPAQEVIAADKKRLVVDAFARFRIVDPLEFYQSNQGGSEEVARSRLSSILNSELRTVLARERFGDILSAKRAVMMRRARDIVDAKARSLGIQVVDVRIRRADLPEANSQAVFARMQTERQQEAAGIRATGEERAREIKATADKNVTILVAEARRDSEILRGLGDGCRNNIYAQAYGTDPDFFAFYRSMQAYERTLKAEGTTLVLSPSSDFFRYFGRVDGAGGGSRSFSGGRSSVPQRAGNSCDRAFAAIALANMSSISTVAAVSALAEITPGATRNAAIADIVRKAVAENKVEALRSGAQSSTNADVRTQILQALSQRNAKPAALPAATRGAPAVRTPATGAPATREPVTREPAARTPAKRTPSKAPVSNP